MATVDKNFRIKNGLVVEGSTATVNGHDVLTEAIVDAKGDLLVASGADQVAVLPVGSNGYVLTADSNATNGVSWSAPQAVGEFGSSILFEGSTANAFETTVAVTDPTADRTITFPDATGTVALTSDISTHSSDTTSIHGIDDTAELATKTFAAELLTNATKTNITITGDKNGLTITAENGVADSNTDNLSEGSTNKYFTDERAQDAVGNSVGSGLSYNDSTGAISVDTSTIQARVADVSDTEIGYLNGVTSGIQTQIDSKFASADASTTNISEGTNLYFTNERAQDAIGNSLGSGLSYNDSTGAISVDTSTIQARVADVSDTEIGYLNGVTSAIQTQIDSKLSLSGGTMTGAIAMGTNKITGLGTPTSSTDAATKAYVDSVTEGLHIHESVVAATTANVNLANALENGDTLDGVTLATGNRILVKNQTTTSENGIYVVQASGQPVRATDFDTATEVDSGDFVFVYSGTVNASTGWVQTNKPATIGTDAIVFTQFSGAGTYLAGNGLTLTGNTFTINTGVTVDLNTAQTLTNKTIDGSNNTLSNIGNSSLTNSAITINGTSVSLGGTRTLGSDDISEGSTNKYFTDERAQDAIGNNVGTGLSYNDSTGAISVTANTYDAYGSAATAQTNAETTAANALSAVTAGTTAFTAINVNSVAKQVAATTGNIVTAAATTAYSWAKSSYRSAEFLVKSKTATHTEVTKIMLTLDSSDNVYLTEYGMSSTSGTSLQSITADISGTDVRIRVTPANNNTEVLITGTLLV